MDADARGIPAGPAEPGARQIEAQIATHPEPFVAAIRDTTGIRTTELRSRLIRQVHYDPATHLMGVAMRTGRLVVYDNVPAELAVLLGRHPAPGVFYEQTIRTLLAQPRWRFSPTVLSFRWRIRASLKAAGQAGHSTGR